MPAAALAAAAAAWLIAIPTLKLKGVYLTVTTLGLNVIIMLVFLNWVELTNGPLGVSGIPAPTLFGHKLSAPADYYYLILAVDVLVIFALSRLVRSRFGRALKAIREDERAAHACGVPLARYKTSAFVLGAAIAGLAGSFYAHYMRYISPDAFSYTETFNIITMLAFGGPGNLLGPIVGSAILISATEAFRVFAAYRMIIFGTRAGRHHAAASGGPVGRPGVFLPDHLAAAEEGGLRQGRPILGRRPAPANGALTPWPFSRFRASASSTAACGRSRTSPSTWPRARSSASSAPTAPARRPCLTVSPDSCRQTRAIFAFATPTSRSYRRTASTPPASPAPSSRSACFPTSRCWRTC